MDGSYLMWAAIGGAVGICLGSLLTVALLLSYETWVSERR